MRRLLLPLMLTIAVFAIAGHPHAAAAQPAPPHRTIAVTALKQSGANGVRLDITLDIPPGADAAAIVRDALARRGAQPVASSDPALQAVLPALHWPQFTDHGPQNAPPVQQFYNPTGDPVPGGTLPSLQADEAAWTAIPSARYAVQYAGTTTRGEAFDGFNTVSWPTTWLDGPSVLAVTITTFNRTTGAILDADIIINGQDHQFFANPADLTPTRVDIRYVLLHENGHVAGLMHSPDPSAVMFAFFAPGIVGHGLAQPDIDAISLLYPLHPLPPPLPFSATASGSVQVNAFNRTAFSGSGTATHLGASQVQGSGGLFPLSSLCIFDFENMTLSTANGDQLSVNFSDVACSTAAAPAVYDGEGTYTITGGTGRLASAHGSGNVVEHVDVSGGFANGTFTLSLTGTIAYPNYPLTP